MPIPDGVTCRKLTLPQSVMGHPSFADHVRYGTDATLP